MTASDTEAAAARLAIATPPGPEGSGRVRYGAAMTLWRAGLMSPEALEVYRVCALLDREDPGAILRARGLTVPVEIPEADPAGAIRALIEAADQYLETLSGPGVAEVRRGIAAARGGQVTPVPVKPNAVRDAHLGPALAALAQTHPALAGAIAQAAPHLDWITYDLYPREAIGPAFAEGHTYASIIGEASAVSARDFDLGVFLIAPHLLYRDHRHAAPELYAPLTGPHGWRFAPGAALTVKPAHEPVWNPPFRHHLTKVGAVPFLCFFGWTRDVNEPAEVIPADDWPELEALRLG
jgi:hypothetical protein